MRMVMAFAGKARAAMTTSQGGQPTGGPNGKTLGGLSRGMSVLGSVMEYASARQEAAGLDAQARDEETARRQEFIRANEQVSAIDAEFARVSGDQLVAASGMGIDVASGSVIAAREMVRDDAERERRRIRNAAETNAAQRRVRSLAYREVAKNARFGATLKLGMDLAQAAF